MEVKAEEAVFENVGQAVHVSFLIMAQEAKQDAPLRAALIKAMESVQLNGRQRCWLEQLRGTASGTINFGGLDGNEVRAQCAMVLQAVKHRLPKTEMWVLQAKYGQTDFEDVDGHRRFAFSVERIEAIKGLADWFRPMFPGLNPHAIDCMLGRLFANHKQLDITVRDLAKSFGASHMTYQRASIKMHGHVRELEQMAYSRLAPSFVADGVVEEFLQ
ncbi:hypothetical protein JAB5_01280 [Janthinobacterium sp. HH103]|uniref:hypothetical protein n=1 Tax=unclassified Janthinobacterium TaxID=2610881 RepID=UPI000873C73D|nr:MULTISPECIES: hypothetical protein [unclassified Janthinobacterium]OEZ68135.1 hypothetical protein JAB2_19450 [Janthinobacterium sp. HH100]OEZ88876.1 hypothetical protein JAB5_01280 [Janthinobacterium sp. HH103]QOU75447.1 hypothetical protein JAB4_049310 [Janthinobacterium sp. HH102]